VQPTNVGQQLLTFSERGDDQPKAGCEAARRRHAEGSRRKKDSLRNDPRQAQPLSRPGRRSAQASCRPATCDKILDATRSRFSAGGYDKVSVRSIAARPIPTRVSCTARQVTVALGVPDPRLAAQLVAAQLIGIVMLRYAVPVEPIASTTSRNLSSGPLGPVATADVAEQVVRMPLPVHTSS
jgi:tetracycline repressor-like protein